MARLPDACSSSAALKRAGIDDFTFHNLRHSLNIRSDTENKLFTFKPTVNPVEIAMAIFTI